MSASFQAKDVEVRERQLKVQTLRIPFVITGNATPASVSISCDEPAVLFLKTQGVDQITGALSPGEASPTYTSPNDAAGQFAILVKINETVTKAVGAVLVRRVPGASGQEVVACSLANTNGLSANGDKLCFNADSGENLAANSLDSYLEVSYVAHQ